MKQDFSSEGTVFLMEMEKTKGPITSFVSGVALGSLLGLGTGYALFGSTPANGRQNKDQPKNMKRDKKQDDSENRDSHKTPSC